MTLADSLPLARVLQRLDAAADGLPAADAVPTGFPSLDRVVGTGLRLGDLVVLAGDVGSGKSALALAIALRAAQQGHAALFLTAEMGVDRTLERLLAIEGRASVDSLRRGTVDDIGRAAVGAAAFALRSVPLSVAPLAASSAGELDALLRAQDGVRLVVVDPMEALGSHGGRDEEVAASVRALKRLALAHDVALLVPTTLPALTIGGRDDLRPTLDDLGGRGAVRQHADLVLGLYREEMYRDARDAEGAVELRVLKNRGGPTGYVDLYFYRQWMRFEDMLDPDR